MISLPDAELEIEPNDSRGVINLKKILSELRSECARMQDDRVGKWFLED